jgi:hypothetical protein
VPWPENITFSDSTEELYFLESQRSLAPTIRVFRPVRVEVCLARILCERFLSDAKR